jgi:hypothetical protein
MASLDFEAFRREIAASASRARLSHASLLMAFSAASLFNNDCTTPISTLPGDGDCVCPLSTTLLTEQIAVALTLAHTIQLHFDNLLTRIDQTRRVDPDQAAAAQLLLSLRSPTVSHVPARKVPFIDLTKSDDDDDDDAVDDVNNAVGKQDNEAEEHDNTDDTWSHKRKRTDIISSRGTLDDDDDDDDDDNNKKETFQRPQLRKTRRVCRSPQRLSAEDLMTPKQRLKLHH